MLRNAVATCMALCAAASPVCAQDIEVGGRYRQSPQVLAHYPDIAVRLSTPATRRGRTTFTSDEEIENYFVKVFQLLGQPVVAKPLGQSGAGRSMLAYYFTAEGLDNLREIRALGRPIVWLIGQQHGNEPAGSEALLQIISDLIDGDLRPLLDKLSIVIVPRANPDGAAANTRDTGAGHDMNRDHIALTLPETRNIHRAVQELPPDLVIDAHEFSVAARWLEKFGGLQAVDLMLLSATHPMVPDPTRELAETVFEPAIKAAAQSHGLTTYAYVTTTSRRDDLAASMGGNAAGIARNAFGLTGAVSILLETRGVGIGMEGFRRRVATHVVAISGALRAAADHADKLKQV